MIVKEEKKNLEETYELYEYIEKATESAISKMDPLIFSTMYTVTHGLIQ